MNREFIIKAEHTLQDEDGVILTQKLGVLCRVGTGFLRIDEEVPVREVNEAEIAYEEHKDAILELQSKRLDEASALIKKFQVKEKIYAQAIREILFSTDLRVSIIGKNVVQHIERIDKQ